MLRFYGCFAASLLVRGIDNIYKRSLGAVFKVYLANYETLLQNSSEIFNRKAYVSYITAWKTPEYNPVYFRIGLRMPMHGNNLSQYGKIRDRIQAFFAFRVKYKESYLDYYIYIRVFFLESSTTTT